MQNRESAGTYGWADPPRVGRVALFRNSLNFSKNLLTANHRRSVGPLSESKFAPWSALHLPPEELGAILQSPPIEWMANA